MRQYTDIGKRRSVHYLALGGLTYLPIDYFLQQHPQVKNVVLCFDRDEPGLRFAETVAQRLAERGFNVEKRLPAVGKDYNESLIWYKSKIEKNSEERAPNNSDCQPKRRCGQNDDRCKLGRSIGRYGLYSFCRWTPTRRAT